MENKAIFLLEVEVEVVVEVGNKNLRYFSQGPNSPTKVKALNSFSKNQVSIVLRV